MTSSVRVSPEAEADIAEAYRWYEDAQLGLGERFLDELKRTLALVASHPEAFGVVHRRVRRALFHRFPYGAYYVVDPGAVTVIGCFHVRRDPSRWHERSNRTE